MTVYLLNKNIFIDIQNKHKTVQTLLKWLFWTRINLDLDIKKHVLIQMLQTYAALVHIVSASDLLLFPSSPSFSSPPPSFS